MLLKPSGIQHFRETAKTTARSRDRFTGAQGNGAGSGVGKLDGGSNCEAIHGGEKPLMFDAITQTDNGEIVFDVDAFEKEQETGVTEDADPESPLSSSLSSSSSSLSPASSSKDTSSSVSTTYEAATSPTATGDGDVAADDDDNSARGDGSSSTKKNHNDHSSSSRCSHKGKHRLKKKMMGMGGALKLGNKNDSCLVDDESDDEYEEMYSEEAMKRRAQAEHDASTSSQPYLRSLHPQGPSPKQWAFDDVVRGAMHKTQTSWGKLKSMVRQIHEEPMTDCLHTLEVDIL